MPADGYVLDASLLAEVGCGDNDVVALLQQLDAANIAIIVPALAVTGATVERTATNEQLAVMRGVGRLDSATFAALSTFHDTVDLARMRLGADTPSELWDVQTALQAVLATAPSSRRTPHTGTRPRRSCQDISPWSRYPNWTTRSMSQLKRR
ncbi:hypothetical protein ACTMTI_11845 [Nonomuraea sp. H19]|uniref:hypothetical protein n=1 Tax=Nonomuraea sp. H19 TaxID=3452206 RepID=UPI003F8C581A